MAEIGIKIGVEGAGQASAALSGVNKSLGEMGKASDMARNALAAIGVGVSVAGFTSWIKGAIDAADAMGDISERTGLAIEEISGLQLAFKMGGVNAEELSGTMAKLSRSVVDNAAAFDAIKVKTKNADGSFKSTRELLGEVADKFASYEDGIEKSALAQELFGKSGASLIPILNMGSKGLAEMDEMAKKLGLTIDKDTSKQAQKFNDTLDLIGLGAKGIATRVAADLLPTLSGLAEQFFTSATKGDTLKVIVERLSGAMKVLYVAGRGVVEAFSAVGKTLGASGAIIASVLSGDFKAAGQIARDLKSDLQAGFKDALVDIEKAWNTTGSASVEALSRMVGEAKKPKAPIVGLKKDVKELGDEFAAQRDAAKDWAKAWEDFNKIGREAAGAADGLTKGQQRLVEFLGSPAYTQASGAMRELALQEAYAAIAAEQNADAQKAAQKAIEDRIKAVEGSADAAEKALADLERENQAAVVAAAQNISLAQAVEQLTISRLEEQRVLLAGDPARSAELAAIEREIEARKRLVGEIRSKDERESAAKAADEAAKAWQKSADAIEQSLTDALMRGFESGKGFLDNLKQTAINAFKTMILQPTIKATIGAVAGSLGFAAPASAAGSAVSSVSQLGSLGSMLGLGGIASGFSAGTGIASGVIAANGYFGGAGMVASYAAEAAAAGELSMAIGAAAPYLLPAAAAIMALVSIMGKGGGPKSGGSSIITSAGMLATDGTSDNGRLYTPATADADLRALTDQAVATVKDTTKRLGGAIGDFVVGLGYDTDPAGDASNRISSYLSTAVGDVMRNINLDLGRDAAALQAGLATEVQRLILAGLQTAQLPSQIDKIFESIDAATATQEQIDGVFKAASAMRTLLDSAQLIGIPLERLSDSMIAAAGGVEAFQSNLAGYYANFYTEQERTKRTTDELRGTFARLGYVMPTTREAFRALVEGMQSTLAEGLGGPEYEAALGTILSLQGTFAALVPASTAAADAVGGAADGIAEAASRLEGLGLADLYDKVGLTDAAQAMRKSLASEALGAAGLALPQTMAELQAAVKAALPEQAAVIAEWADTLIGLLSDTAEGGFGGVEESAKTLEQALQALQDPMRSVEQIAQSIVSMRATGAQLSVDLLRAQGRGAEADVAQRTLDTAGLTDAELTIYDYNQSLRDQIAAVNAATAAQQEAEKAAQAVASQRAGLERQLLELQGNSAALRALDRAAIDASNQSLYDQVIALQDAAAAGRALEEQERALAAERGRVATQRAGLERQILELQGDTVALRELDRAAIDASNRDLYDRILALQDSAAAARAAQESEQALAAERAQAASQRATLERQELELLGRTSELRALDRAAIAESNRDIYDRIIALQDSATAARAAEESERALTAERERVANERAGLERQLLELQGDAIALRALDRAALDETNRALYDQIVALQDTAEAERALAADRDRIANQRAGLERELLQLQGDTVALRALDRAAIDESNLAIYDQVVALRDLAAAGGDSVGSVESLADALARLRDPIRSVQDVARGLLDLQAQAAQLSANLLAAQGNTAAAAAAQREIDTAGRTEAEIALMDANAATQKQIDELTAATQAAAAAADEKYRLETRLLELQGDTEALRARAIAGMTAENAALQQKIWATEDAAAAEAAAAAEREKAAQQAQAAASAREAAAAAVANERAGLERQLLELMGDQAAIRAAERDALDPSNRALYDRIMALKDEQAAAEAAARVAEQRQGLEKQLLQLQGDNAALRALERAEIDSANLALYDRINALKDEQAAAEAAKRIADERSGLERQLLQALGDTDALRELELNALDPTNRALQLRIWAIEDEAAAAADATAEAERLASAWLSATDSIRAEVERLRGASGADSYASLQTRFAVSTAQARAGDLAAAQSLANLSKLLVDAGISQSSSTLEAVRLQARVAASLEETASVLEAPGTLTAPTQDSSSVAPITAELAALRDDQRAQASSMAAMQARVARLLERWDADGIPETRVVA